ncbi:hypothetical protein PISMIDRAFT_676143 [Pisolithus microcarpus 441]|uniref:Uncharacterized protein n=1 Tax=Pisolithus microcarpus 441 TaxID=765257 RepID=A0A0C9ZVT0_9AGAM|nr:hypothetical protein PISMIDRAFT_676143 [Pisolithus microcarpus 441]
MTSTQCSCNAKWVPVTATDGGVADESAFLPAAVAAPLTTALAPLAPVPASTKFSSPPRGCIIATFCVRYPCRIMCV